MALSASWIAATALVLLVGTSAGCSVTTTQEKDERLEVKAERVIVKPGEIDLTRSAEGIDLLQTAALRGKDQTVVAVRIRNTTDEPVNDLPIAVGVRGEGDDAKDEFLNIGRGTPYFQSHVPVIAGGEEATWVYASKKDVPKGELFAKVGTPPDPPLTTADELPKLDVSHALESTGKDSATVHVKVVNSSDIPQYELELYAWAADGKDLLAAGTASLAALEGGETANVNLRLAGDPKSAPVEVFVPPTIFQ